jgi:dienelactone hydrolase
MNARTSVKILLIGLGTCALGCEAPQPEMTPEVPETQGPDIRGEEVAYEMDGVDFTGYIAYDANQEGPRPGVIVVHEWWGHTDYVRMRADMLAELGYTAFALDMFGDGKLAEHPQDAQKFATEIVTNMDVGVARFEQAKRILEQHPTTDSTRTAAIGYCFGGGLVLHMARVGSDLDGVVSFHGGLDSGVRAGPGDVKAAVLVLNGGADLWVTQEAIAAFEQEMDEAGVDYTFINYHAAVHGFTNPAATEKGIKYEIPIAYNPQADSLSWEEMQQFFGRIF